jgi:hypothetical protein
MNKIMGAIVALLIFIGSALIGVELFGEGASAAYFAAVVGGGSYFWLITKMKD